MGRGRIGALVSTLVLLTGAGLGAARGGAGAQKTGARSAGAPFDERRALALTRLQLAFGPRPAGSASERRAGDLLRTMLPGGRFEPVAGGLRNVVGSLPGREPAIVLGAHYDTTPLPGYQGANNGAAGVAAVVEIARDLARDRPRPAQPAMRFVLFDGEEAPPGFSDFFSEGLRGSRAYVHAHAKSTRELILMDFVALRHERLAREAGSDAALWGRLRRAARRAGRQGYFSAATVPEVLDDHTLFARAGIPAVDLVDLRYPCWQRRCDDFSQVSSATQAATGSSVLALMRAELARPR